MSKTIAPKQTLPGARGQVWVWIKQRQEVLLTLLVAAAGTCLVLLNTQLGAYWSDDTYYYILPAREFMRGMGFHPSFIFGPVLPFVLAAISMARIDPLESIRWLNAILFAVNIFLVSDVTRRISRTPWFSVLAALLMLIADVIVEIHGWAMSEALAITFTLLAIDFCLQYFIKSKLLNMLLATLFASLAVLTRFASLPLIPTICLAILLFDPAKRLIISFRNAFGFGLASLSPFVAYLFRNMVVSGTPLRYQQFLQVPFDRSQFVWFLYNWLSLFFPGRFIKSHEIVSALVAVFLLTLLGVFLYRHAKRRNYQPVLSVKIGILLCACMAAFSILMLYIARGFTELMVFNPRYLIPPYLFTLILLVVITSQLWQYAGYVLRAVLVCILGAFFTYYGYRTYEFTNLTARTGLGYSNIGWHESETIKYILGHPEITDMVSTGEMGIYFWTGRMPIVLAAFSDASSLDSYLCQHRAPFFLMNQMPAELYGMSQTEATSGLTLVKQFNDSSMYECPMQRSP